MKNYLTYTITSKAVSIRTSISYIGNISYHCRNPFNPSVKRSYSTSNHSCYPIKSNGIIWSNFMCVDWFLRDPFRYLSDSTILHRSYPCYSYKYVIMNNLGYRREFIFNYDEDFNYFVKSIVDCIQSDVFYNNVKVNSCLSIFLYEYSSDTNYINNSLN